MDNVIVDKNKIDLLANAIADKSGEALTMTLDEMVEAVDGIEVGGGITPTGTITISQNGTTDVTNYATADVQVPQPTGNINITQAGVTDVTNYATATVPSAAPWIGVANIGFYTDSNNRRWRFRPMAEFSEGEQIGWMDTDTFGDYWSCPAIANGTTVTPTESSQTIGDANTMMEGAVTVEAIPSNYVGSGITQRSSSDLTASGATVTAPSGYYANNATKTITSGSATPASTISGTSATVTTGTNTITLSKSVSNTPQVSAGYISSGTAGNSSVSLTASVTTKGATTYTPTTSNQTIASGTYLTGTQTISGDANLVAGNIKSGTTIFGVTGTYTGGGGSSDVVIGTLTVASNVNTSTSTQITTTSAIGFTPTKFFFYKDTRTATSNHVHQATFTTMGSYYIRTMTRYSSNALSTSGNTNNWTTQTAGYLYFNSNTIYFRSSSSYILSSGTWYWVAVK